jgi:hypothetical protein
MVKTPKVCQIDSFTEKKIFALIAACNESNLGNVSFDQSLESPKRRDAAKFYLMKRNKDYWNLTVINDTGLDRYIVSDRIALFYSENLYF